MIKNKYIAIVLLVLMIAGAVLFTVFRSLWGPIITLIGICGYLLFNRGESG
jgi:general stress protein CsbA